MKLFALMSVERGRKADPSTVAPGGVWNATDAEVRDLLPMRAARPATEDEIKLVGGDSTPPADPAAATTARGALEARARELGVTFNKNLSDEKLGERIAEAEAKANDGLV